MIGRSATAILLVAAAWLAGGALARADVVPARPQGYSEAEEYGDEVEYWTDYRTPNGIPWEPRLGPSYGITANGVEWVPEDLPVTIQLGADGKGRWLFMASLIHDRDGKNACWKFEAIGKSGPRTPKALEHFFLARATAWARSCDAIRTFGTGTVLARLEAARPDLGKALRKLSASAGTRYLEERRGVSIGSYHPRETSPGLLNAIADACAVPRAGLRLEDGAIRFEPPASGDAEADGKADICVTGQIRYLPGFRERT